MLSCPLTLSANYTSALDKDLDKTVSEISKARSDLEAAQARQAEDSRGISKQQKSIERYLAKKQMLSQRKEECSNNIRDLGVLPEEAFEKYTNDKLDRVSMAPFPSKKLC